MPKCVHGRDYYDEDDARDDGNAVHENEKRKNGRYHGSSENDGSGPTTRITAAARR